MAIDVVPRSLGNPIELIKSEPTVVLRGRAAQMTRGSLTPVYAKLLSQPAKAVELAAAWIGRNMGLPIPEAMLVTVRRDKLPKKAPWPFQGELETCFASVEIPLARPVSRLDEGAVLQLLRRWTYLSRAAVFDQLIANDDRTRDNVLLDANNRFWLIDHARALGGVGKPLFSDVFPLFRNFLLECVKDFSLRDRLARRSELSSAIGAAEESVRTVPYSSLGIDDELAAQIDDVLGRRSRALRATTLSHIGIPELFSDQGIATGRSLQ
jgi:hypothetical protein